MFYSQFILAKKGPLGTIWIAAHLERKLRKNQVADTDIGVSVDSILSPDVPIALRLSSHLLLGVVRIYSKKVNYLFDDCSDALLKVKQAFRSTAVDLPPEQSKAPYHSITLPETFDLDDFEIPDDEISQGNFVDHHVSAREQITLQDTLEGVAFSTSRFGPDERFGDGDASQIGLDLDEDMFLDKNEAAGTSGVSMDMDVVTPAPVEASSPVKDDDDHNESDIDPSVAASANHFSIQGPSTPGLIEEPNLPTAQALVSDDHIDEDHSPSNHQELPHFGNQEFYTDGSCYQHDEEKAKSLGAEFSAEAKEIFTTTKTQALVSDEHVEATNGPHNIGHAADCYPVESESNMAVDIPFEGYSNKMFTPLPDIAPVMEVHSENSDKNGPHPLMSETKSENTPSRVSENPNFGKTDLNIGINVSEPYNECEAHPSIEISETKSGNVPSVGPGVPNLEDTDLNLIYSTSECQIEGDPYPIVEISETFGPNIERNLSAPTMPVLQNCNSHVQNAIAEVDFTSNFSVNDGLCLVGIPGKDDSTNVSSISTNVQDSMKINLGTSHPTNQVTDAGNSHVDGNLYDKISVENNLEKENGWKTSDLAAIEKMLFMPNLTTGQHVDLFVERTPIQENIVDADNVVSGRKRSYTESTMTVQSLYSVESSGAAQSKRSVELIPEDGDLLSSILVGRRSTTLKMKPTPPVANTTSTKRKRVAVRTTPQKRKVLVDEATVLHGDMIRQQLTSTEDIRRVRMKAPCTRLEIWMVQRQFLEDEIFTKPVFTGMSENLVSLHYETFDLGRISVFKDIKGTDKADTSAKGTLGEEAERASPVVPSDANASTQNNEGSFDVPSNLDGERRNDSENMESSSKAMSGPKDITVPSTISNGSDQHHMESLEFPSNEISILGLDGNSVQKETKTLDNEVPKEGPQCQASETKVEMEKLLGCETTGPISEVNCNLEADNIANSSHLNETGDVDSVHIDTSCQLEDERCEMNFTKEGTSTPEDGVFTTKGLDFDKNSDAECLLEGASGVDKVVTSAEIPDHFSSLHDGNVSVPFKDEAHPTSDHIMEEHQLGDFVPKGDCSLPVHDEFVASDQRDNGGAHTRNIVESWDADPKMAENPTTVDVDHIDGGDHADYGREAIEHDTDFLNVDDDDDVEDYESDMPNADEKRILDNTGWSARTRAVANYLQLLFEKDAQHGQNNVSVDGLVAGKSRKEAARMFFETLVLKTKDYIQVEQESAFGDIRINPQGKLLKSEF